VPVRLTKIIAGGQTGADQGALDAALDVGFGVGGWCTNGRRTEDGPLPERYNFLKQTPLSSYPQRTEWNVRDSDGTMIVHCGSWGPGTKKTVSLVKAKRKPYIFLDLRSRASMLDLVGWLSEKNIETLNVAGPRESGSIGIHKATYDFVTKIIKIQKGITP
jgi:hypothetical protein